MEPRREERQKALGSRAEQKPRRFRITKLEERVAPAKGGTVNFKQCGFTYFRTCTGNCGPYTW